MRFRKLKIVFIILSLQLIFCIIPENLTALTDIHRKNQPLPEHLQELEKEILEKAERFIKYIEGAGALYYDSKLEKYLNVIAKVVTRNFGLSKRNVDIYIKVIRDPAINAFALHNGRIYLTTGLLARLQNEAQLAFILGHEISHIVNKDMVYFMDSVHENTIAIKLLDLVVSPVSACFGALSISELGLGLIYGVTVTGYSRNQEARADEEGLSALAKSKYNPQGAIEIFDILLKESEKYQKGIEVYFLSSHPSNVRRRKEIQKMIDTEYAERKGAKTEVQRFLAVAQKVKVDNAALNIKFDRIQHAIDNLTDVLEKNPENYAAHFHLGEAYRRLAEDRKKLKYELSTKEWYKIKKINEEEQKKEWLQKAHQEYKLALRYNSNYPQPYKGLAFYNMNNGNDKKAVLYFKKYLELNPYAEDKRYIRSCLRRLMH